MPFDAERYAAGLRHINRQERERTVHRTTLAHHEAMRIASAIGAQDADVRRVYLFGSLAGQVSASGSSTAEAPRNTDFDIDLALDGGDVYRATEATESSQFRIDLVVLSRLPEHVRDRVVRTGTVLYERNM